MTEQETPSQFNQRADNAALALKGDISQQIGRDLPSRQVEVGPDGRPPKPPPPEGSYARQEYDRQRAAAAAAAQQQQVVLGDQPEAGALEHAADGSQAPPLLPPGTPPQEQAGQPVSDKANARIQELTQKLRAQEQELQAAMAQAQEASNTRADLEKRFNTLEEQHRTMLQSNLENLDPETRLQVMQDARMREYMDEMEKRILSSVMPHVQEVKESNAQNEMMRLAHKYPAFDLQVHGPSIDMFRGKNPSSSIEQAFKAIAEPEELVTRQVAAAAAVPPVVPPGGGGVLPRYMPEPQSNPEQEMIEEAGRARDLMTSDNPRDHKAGLRMFDANIAARLAHRLPGNR
jgi:hypothetical protein